MNSLILNTSPVLNFVPEETLGGVMKIHPQT